MLKKYKSQIDSKSSQQHDDSSMDIKQGVANTFDTNPSKAQREQLL